MKPQTLLPLSTLLAFTQAANKNFRIPSMTTHQPNGNPAGQVNYYNIGFSVTSTNSGSQKSGYCNTFWGDNSWLDLEAYSTNVPDGEWFPCDSSGDSLGDDNSVFQFKLFPYFSIGNFRVEVKEALSSTKSLYGEYHFHNKTSWYTCDISGTQVDYGSHASGDCSIPDGQGPIQVQVYQTEQVWSA